MTDRRGGGQQDDWSTGQYQQYAQEQYGQGQAHPQYEQPQYDQYGQPVPQAYQQGYDAYRDQYAQEQYGQGQAYPQYEQQPYEQPQYDQYGQPVPQAYQQGYDAYRDQYAQDQYGQVRYGQGQVYQQPAPQPAAPQPAAEPPAAPAPAAPAPAPVPPRPRPARTAAEAAPAAPEAPSEQVGGRAARGAKTPKDGYTTGEFTFVDEAAEESEDVIDWLKFAESRSERRDERRRKLRTRLIGAAVALAVLAGGVGGYLWFTKEEETAASAAGARQVNVVHLRDLQGKVSTALLVNDQAGKKGTVLLLPDTLKLPGPGDPPVTTLGQAMDTVGASGTRDGLATVLGAPVAGTWRLDTPFLRLLVSQLGGVRVDTNAESHEGGRPEGKLLAPAGKNTLLSGQAAVEYATYQAPGEGRDAQLARFGQVMDAVVRTTPTEIADAKDAVRRMNGLFDPSLPEEAVAGVLAQLSQQAKDGHLTTTALPVKPDGTLDDATAGKQVKEVLGGTVKAAQSGEGTARVSIQDASGNDAAAAAAQVQVVNAGLTFVPGGAKSAPQPTSEIRYTDDARQAGAKSLAQSLGLPETAVKKVTDPQNADLVVVLGKDYQPPKAP